MRKLWQYVLALLAQVAVTWAWAQPRMPEELAIQRRAATQMLLTVVVALTAIILLLRFIGQREREVQTKTSEEQKPEP